MKFSITFFVLAFLSFNSLASECRRGCGEDYTFCRELVIEATGLFQRRLHSIDLSSQERREASSFLKGKRRRDLKSCSERKSECRDICRANGDW